MEQTINTEKMNALKALADTNLKVSEARNVLFKLQEDEMEYLEIREKKALIKIQKALSDSQELIDETHKNYEKVTDFCQIISNYFDFLDKTHEKVQKMIDSFNERNEIWDKSFTKQQEDIAYQKRLISQDSKMLDTKEKQLNEMKVRLKKQQEHLESRQATLEASYKVEKSLWDKINL